MFDLKGTAFTGTREGCSVTHQRTCEIGVDMAVRS